MSYSHAADGRLAPALHAALHRFAKPWYRLRAVHVFRDQTTLHPTPRLWESIRAAIDRSTFFILLASPDAAASPWVEREVAYWLQTHLVERMLIVVTDGTIAWDPASGAFDPARTTALPGPLIRAFDEEPLWLDLRWARSETDLSLGHPRFQNAVAELAAALHGRSKDTLVGEDVRQHRRTRRIAWSAASALGVLALVSSVAARVAIQQRNEAETQRAAAVEQSRIALARQLAAESSSIGALFPDRLPLAALLAVESTRRYESFAGNQALRTALAPLPRLVRSFPYDPFGDGRVRALAFSPDGAWLAVARDNGGTDLFQLHEGRRAGTLHPDSDPITLDLVPEGYEPSDSQNREEATTVAFGPAGRFVATGGNDGVARVWETASGRELLRVEVGGRIRTVAVSPDGRHLAIGSEDGRARVFAAADGRPLGSLERTSEVRNHAVAHDEEVRVVAFSPAGHHLAALSTDGGISLSAVDTGKVARMWYAGSAGLALAFSRDGRRLATANGNFAYVWDVETGQQLFRATHAPTRADIGSLEFYVDVVAFSPDGEYLATAGGDTARVWTLETQQERVRLEHSAPVSAVAFGPDGTTLSTGSYDGTARLWELPSGRERLRATHPGGAEVVMFGPDGAQVASGGSDGQVNVWSLDRGDRVASTTHRNEVQVVAFSPDGTRVASADRDELRVWSSAGVVDLALRDVVYGAGALAFSHDGRLLAGRARAPYLFSLDWATGAAPSMLATSRDVGDVVLGARHILAEARDSGNVRVWETASGRELAPAAAAGVRAIKQDPASTTLAIKHADAHGTGAIRLRSIAGARDVGQLPIDRSRGDEFAVHPGGRLLAVSVSIPKTPDERGNHQFVEVWDVPAARRLARIPQDDVVAFVAFDRSGQRLLTIVGSFATERRQIQVWDWASERLLGRMRHEEEIERVRFGGDPDLVATVSAGRVYLWKLPTGELLGQIADGGYVRDVQFSPDGRLILTGAADGTAAIWLWKTADLRAEACRRLTRNLTREEWQQYLGATPYEPTCPGLDGDGPVHAAEQEAPR
jgi:WD40 repeat protein